MMDFNEFRNKAAKKADSVFETAVTFVQEHMKLSLAAAALCVAVLVLIIILSDRPSSKTEPRHRPPVVTEQLVPPDGPEIPGGYTIIRQKKDSWTEEETSSWFTSPSEKEIDSLGRTNDNIISGITGAAP